MTLFECNARAFLRVLLFAGLVGTWHSVPAQQTTAAAPVPLLPAEAYAGAPRLSNLSLSPDGSRVLALSNEGDNTLVVTRDVADGAWRAALRSDNETYRIRWVTWAGDDRLLVSVVFASRRGYIGTTETRLLSVRTDGSDLVNVLKNPPGSGVPPQYQDSIIDYLPEEGGRHVLMALTEPRSVLPGVYRVDVRTGQRTMVQVPQKDVYQWITDRQHRVRIAIRRVETTIEVRVRDPEGAAWRTAWSFDKADDMVWPCGFGEDPQELFVSAPHEGRLAMFSVRLDDPTLKRTLRLAPGDNGVVDGDFVAGRTGRVLGAHVRRGVGDAAETSVEWSDPAWAAQQKAVDLALPGRKNRLFGVDAREQTYLLSSSEKGRPATYYAGDRRTGDLFELGAIQPDLARAVFSTRRKVDIPGRDGKPFTATWVTAPSGGADDPPRPLVVVAWGGPGSTAGTWLDLRNEFLVSRGHAVLAVNFRGDVGEGHSLQMAGLKPWGAAMQQDLDDAVKWAVAQGQVDPARVCLLGEGNAGYGVLMAALRAPERYRCAISLAGVTDLPDLAQYWMDFVQGPEAVKANLGDVHAQRDELEAASPALQAARYRVPLLLVHGTSDRRVPVEQSAALAKALKRAGKPHRYVALDGGDHGLSRYTHRLEFFKAMEAFLAEHLAPAPRAAAAAAPATGS